MTRKNQRAQPRAQQSVKPPHIDWQQLITDLRAHGCSLHAIAEQVGVEYSTAQRWRSPRKDIGYGYGRALIRLHARHCGAALTLKRLEAADDCAYTSPA